MTILRLQTAKGRAAHLVSSALGALAIAIVGLVGCGDDSSDEGENKATDAGAPIRDSGRSPSGSTTPKNFVVACTSSVEKTCDEYLGDTKNASTIEEAVDDSCRQAGEVVTTERCSSADLVGTCLGMSGYGEVVFWAKTSYYAPLTEAQVKTRCQGATFEPAP